MSLIPLLANEDVGPEERAIFAAVEAQYGFVPNILRTMAHSPELLAVFVPFWAKVYESPAIGPRLRALAALGTAKAQDCTYCIAHMSASARRAGVSDDEIAAIGEPLGASCSFDEREALILEVADVVTARPDEVDDRLKRRLLDLFTTSEIVSIVVAVGTYNLTSRFLKALDIEVESVLRPDDAASPATDGTVAAGGRPTNPDRRPDERHAAG